MFGAKQAFAEAAEQQEQTMPVKTLHQEIQMFLEPSQPPGKADEIKARARASSTHGVAHALIGLIDVTGKGKTHTAFNLAKYGPLDAKSGKEPENEDLIVISITDDVIRHAMGSLYVPAFATVTDAIRFRSEAEDKFGLLLLSTDLVIGSIIR
jgi:hypothetical protein